MSGKDRRSEIGKWEGRKVGRLTIGPRIKRDDGVIGYLCKCDCGNEKFMRATSIACSRTHSCGCYARDLAISMTRLPQYGRQGPSIHTTLRYYQRGAKVRHLAWNLTHDEFMTLCNGSCYYCGALPSVETRAKCKGDPDSPNAPLPFRHSGIDRVDPTQGYTITNCVSCCPRCNWMKGSMTVTEFKQHVRAIYEHFIVR